MVTQKRREDRRIQRTRQMLQRAFLEVMQEKGSKERGIWDIERGFAATSIQDITERANVNRGTFYLHFADKYMLLDAVVREQFQQQIASELSATARWDRRSLRLLILVVLESFEQKYCHQQHPSHVLAPLLERAMQEELAELIFIWLKRERGGERQGRVELDMIARVVSWAIFGAAIQWSQEETKISLEQMADAILLVVMEGAGKLAYDALLE